MMSLESELRHVVDDFLRGGRSLGDVHTWLTGHVQVTLDDAAVRDLSDRVWMLISEYDRDDRSEESLRQELARLAVAA